MKEQVRIAFKNLMKAVHRQNGSSLSIEILSDPETEQFIDTHAAALNGAIASERISSAMRSLLEQSNRVFSGFKAFHEANEAFPSLLDDDGNRKPFNRFLKDVKSINEKYNSQYLKAEYNFANAASEMAGRWESFSDSDRYYLQYRTAGDDKVREAHRRLDGIVLPKSSKFWDSYYPPNGWNCRCTVVEVRKSKYPVISEEEACRLGEGALDKKGMFRGNPGKQGSLWPDYNPYTISDCSTCDRKLQLARASRNELCAACPIIHKCADYSIVPTEKGKLRIHSHHGTNERKQNVEAAKYFAERYGDKIDLLPVRKGDKVKSADAINHSRKQLWDFKIDKEPTYSAIDKGIRKANKQADHAVLLIKSDISENVLSKAVHDRMRKCGRLQSVIIVKDGKDYEYNRESILKNDFKIKWTDLK